MDRAFSLQGRHGRDRHALGRGDRARRSDRGAPGAPPGVCARCRPTTRRSTTRRGRGDRAEPGRRRRRRRPARRLRRRAPATLGRPDLLDVALDCFRTPGAACRSRGRLQAFLGTAEVPATWSCSTPTRWSRASAATPSCASAGRPRGGRRRVVRAPAERAPWAAARSSTPRPPGTAAAPARPSASPPWRAPRPRGSWASGSATPDPTGCTGEPRSRSRRPAAAGWSAGGGGARPIRRCRPRSGSWPRWNGRDRSRLRGGDRARRGRGRRPHHRPLAEAGELERRAGVRLPGPRGARRGRGDRPGARRRGLRPPPVDARRGGGLGGQAEGGPRPPPRRGARGAGRDVWFDAGAAAGARARPRGPGVGADDLGALRDLWGVGRRHATALAAHLDASGSPGGAATPASCGAAPPKR